MKFVGYEACPRCRSNHRDTRGDNLGVWADGSQHCFSCGYHRGGRFSPTYLETTEVKDNGSKGMPADFSREVPARAWKWLLQYGLGYRYWKPFVGWSEKDSRLVFPISADFSTGRYIEPENSSLSGGSVAVPNREGAQPRKWFHYGNAHRAPHLFRPDSSELRGPQGYGERVVLVEDLISAHKVGHLQTAIPLFGTNVPDACIPVLRHIGLPITLWLDADQQGNVIKKASNLSILTGLPVSYLFTEQDPKCLPLEQIQAILK